MKLSPAQRDVVERMASGWQLAVRPGGGSRLAMTTETVCPKSATVENLKRLGLIRPTGRWLGFGWRGDEYALVGAGWDVACGHGADGHPRCPRCHPQAAARSPESEVAP